MLPLFAALITLCSDIPHHGGKWLYRIIDGHKCWFQESGLKRGREKPKEELKWPQYGQPEGEGEFELRWKGESK